MKIPFVLRQPPPPTKASRDDDRVAKRAALRELKQRAGEERERRKAAERAARAAEARAAEELSARAYAHYQAARGWLSSVGVQPTPRSWVWDASPDTIANLRQRIAANEGLDLARYADRSSAFIARLKREAGFLRKQAGSELFVPEPSALGGFGFLDQGVLYNEDTVRFFTAMIALNDAALLHAFRDAPERRLVWEIGAGWGGFAYQFKKLCPNVTYVITAPPELLVMSSVYLQATMPSATVRYVDHRPGANAWASWQDVDFMFVPDVAETLPTPPRLDLAVDILALRQMPRSAAAAHISRVFTGNCPFFYTALPRAVDAGDGYLSDLERSYWLHPVPPRRDPKFPDVEPSLRHIAGWKRLLA